MSLDEKPEDRKVMTKRPEAKWKNINREKYYKLDENKKARTIKAFHVPII